MTCGEFDLSGILNRIVEGDAIEVMSQLPDECIDLALCDPPYAMTDNAWDAAIPFGPMWEQLERILKPHAAAVLCASGRFTSRLIESQGALRHRHRWFWDKGRTGSPLRANHAPLRQVEELVVLARKSAKYHPQKTPCRPHKASEHVLSANWRSIAKPRHDVVTERFPTDLLRLETDSSDVDRIHPTQKPLALGRYMVRTYSDPGDVVLDFACGSGSFPVASLAEGRNFIGIERNQDVMAVKSPLTLTDLHRASCVPVREIDARHTEYRVDCVAFARGRVEKTWRALTTERRASIRRVGWIAEFEAGEEVRDGAQA